MPETGIPVYLDTPLGTISFNGSFGPGVPQFRLDGDGGFTIGSALRNSYDDLPGRDGSILPDAFYGKGMTSVLRGTIRTATNADRATALDTLRGYCRALARADGTLRWTPTGMTERRLVVRLLDDPLDGGSIVKTFQLSLVSESPVTESSTLKSFDTSSLTAATTSGVEFPAEFPLDFGDASSNGQVVVTNAGNADAYPVVRVYGAIQAPVLRNLTTGLYVSLPGLTLNDGDFAEIDMKAETIRMNGADTFSLVGYLDVLNSSFWTLPVGASTVYLSGGSPDSFAKATILFRDSYA